MDNIGNFVSASELSRQEGFKRSVREKIKDKSLRAFVFTLGCQQNEADSERIMGILCDLGYTPT